MIVPERAVLNRYAIDGGRYEAEPYSRRAVVRRHADGAGVVPKAPVDDLRKGQPAMPADDAVDTGVGELRRFDRVCSRRKDEAVDRLDTAVHHCQPASANLDVDPARQVGHPDPRVRIELTVGM